MRVFAIRHKPSGEYMPAQMFRTARRGWSYWDPGSEECGGVTIVPRLFATIGPAKRALNAWLVGPIAPGGQCIRPAVPRRRDEMEIIECQLNL